MERGSLQEERRPSKLDPAQPNGPYFKHQVWEAGKNQTRRVPREEAEHLATAIKGRQQFEALAEQFVEITVAMTREQQEGANPKKNARSSKRLSSRKPEG